MSEMAHHNLDGVAKCCSFRCIFEPWSHSVPMP
jgi:hypothetical protein